MKHLAAFAFVVTACSPYSISGPRPPSVAPFGPSRADAGTICVVRASAFARSVMFVVHDNRQLVGATKGDSYFCYEAAPGEHTIVSDTFDSVDHPGSVVVSIAPGARYWLLQDHENNLGSVTSKLAWIDEQRARQLVERCEYKVVTSVPGHEELPPAVPFVPAA
ncbi:MAG: hypothetical protein SFX73_19770 [Kofleriaceae bacterium]|nr:hypothetical protein [Kofleriaceae bacterium]